jgi:dihydrofolate reductase
MISIVVAHSSNRVIGRDGGLPWSLPTDLRRFRELTTGGTVVMGRKTFESLPDAFRPLPKRRNVVLCRDPAYAAPGAEVAGSLDSALAACAGECFVIGGGQTYAEALPLARRVYATHVRAHVSGDVYFPDLPEAQWRRVSCSEPVRENGHEFAFEVYDRHA